MKFFKKVFFVLCVVAVVVFPIFVFAQVTINYQIPGTQPASANNPCTTVINFYMFALLISGILAFGAIVWGGIKYAVSAGNPSGQSEGKDWIKGALLGILLLAASYLILNIINPALVHCSLPELSKLPATTATQPSGWWQQFKQAVGGGDTGSTPGSGPYPSLSDAGFACKPADQQPNQQASCSADPKMVDTLKCIQEKTGNNFMVTEAMPPTVPHTSQCHNDGCCVDVVVNSGNCADVQAIVSAAQACGSPQALNEYANCGGTTYNTTTGNNIHIQGKGCQ